MRDTAKTIHPPAHAGFLTVKALGAWAGVGVTKIFELLATGQLEGRKFGGRTLITSESAERWAASLPAWRSTKAIPATAETKRARRAP